MSVGRSCAFRLSVSCWPAPPAKGALRAALTQLAAREWRHPSTGAPVRFSVSTLERWFYKGRNEPQDPLGVLRRKRRQDAGEQASMATPLRQALLAQYNAHKSWSAQLHHDNLAALAETRPELRPVPSYATVRRFLAAHGLTKRHPITTRQTEGALAAAARLEAREVRSYESEYSNGTWHWDCHNGSRKVLTPRGEWRTPILFGVLDDHSRLVCHLQWYLAESAENIAHGLSQAMQKRGLPRAAMSDNGAAMTATEITEGLARLGILHQTTLPYSPYANGKQETLWGSVEGRLMAMLEGVDDLSLARLNEATQAWVEQDYNRKHHSEIDDTPLARFLAGPAVTRPCPDAAALRLAFTRTERRSLRKSDGTAAIEAAASKYPIVIGIFPCSRSATPPGISPRSTSSIRTPARCSAGYSRRTRPPTHPASGAACSRSSPSLSHPHHRQPAASDRCWRA
jgi:putative transposase